MSFTTIDSMDDERMTSSITTSASVSTENHHLPAADTSGTSTTSVNRAFSDLDPTKFVLYSTALCGIRMALQHPMNLALARKQVCPTIAGMSSMAVVQGILRTEGGFFRGLSTGMAAYVGGTAISEGMYLGMFEYLREHLPVESDPTREAASGYVADVGCRLVHIPLMVVAYRQMTTPYTSASNKRGLFSVGASVFREGGCKSLFAGLGMTLMIGCQWTALWWAMYTEMKKGMYSWQSARLSYYHNRYVASTPQDNSWGRSILDSVLSPTDNVAINATASAAASASTAVVFNPFLVLRAKIQSQSQTTLLQAAKQIYGQSGVMGFFRGTTLSISLCVVDGVLATTSYEYAKLWSDKSMSA